MRNLLSVGLALAALALASGCISYSSTTRTVPPPPPPPGTAVVTPVPPGTAIVATPETTTTMSVR